MIREAARRRTFAIISHPDAGKTTLTEKFLLYAGAVQRAGAVKARDGRRSATSDWMEMEQQRGISISSTVLQFPYRDHDHQPARHARSPRLLRGHVSGARRRRCRGDGARHGQGHRAPDAQAVRGLPSPAPAGAHVPQQVRPPRPRAARAARRDRGPDRPAPDAGHVAGRHRRRPARRRSTAAPASTSDSPAPTAARRSLRRSSSPTDARRRARRARRGQTSQDEIGLLDAVGADVDLASFLAGESTPCSSGSALTNFGVRMLLDAIVDLAPAPTPRIDVDGRAAPARRRLSRRSCSRCRRTWTRRTATGSPSPASARAASSAA